MEHAPSNKVFARAEPGRTSSRSIQFDPGARRGSRKPFSAARWRVLGGIWQSKHHLEAGFRADTDVRGACFSSPCIAAAIGPDGKENNLELKPSARIQHGN